MTKKLCEMNNICRLCLCDDDEALLPISCIIDTSLTDEDIERFTGIELFEEENISYTVCDDCTNKLKKCALFRARCLSNDVQFKRMFVGSGIEWISPAYDNATVELSVEPHESAIKFEAVDIKNIHKTEEPIIDEHDKESNVELVLEEQPFEGLNVTENDWAEGFEARIARHIVVVTDSEAIKPEEDEAINSTSQNNEGNEGNGSPRKLPKRKTSLNANSKTSKTVRKYPSCNICGKTVSNPKCHLQYHVNAERFACPYCPHKTRYQKDLNNHIKSVHQKEAMNSTSQNNEEDEGNGSLPKLPKRKTSLNANSKTSKTARKYPSCNICGKTVSNPKCHLQYHVNAERFACPYCPHKTRYQKDLNTHIKSVHRKEISKTCEICGQDFRNPLMYNNHMTSMHGAGEYECVQCSKKFTHITAYNTHLRRIHNTKRPKQLCGICGAMVANISMHLKTHTQERKHSCPHCPLKMVDSGNLTRHIKSVHLQKPVKSCEICNLSFKYASVHNTHMLRVHGTGKTFDCSKCSSKFNHQTGLRSHMARAHSNVKKYVCKTCGIAFKFGTNLKVHQLVHSMEQPYACNQCPKRFKSKYARKTHQLTHSGILFSCTHCEKSYRYKALLNMHIRQKHPETITVKN